MVFHQSHNLDETGSIPVPATKLPSCTFPVVGSVPHTAVGLITLLVTGPEG